MGGKKIPEFVPTKYTTYYSYPRRIERRYYISMASYKEQRQPHVVQVAIGCFHALLLGADGTVWSTGTGEEVQLGHRVLVTSWVPKPIAALVGLRIVQVAAGAAHSLFRTEGGDVLSCGFGCKGQLGHGDKETQLVPKLVAALKGRRVVQVEAGDNNSMFVTKGGAVLFCGKGAGEGPSDINYDLKEDKLVPTRIVAGLKGMCVVQVSLSNNHVLFLTKDGEVLSCGDGWNGRLGHGNTEHQLVPKLIVALKGRRVVQVEANGYCSLYLLENGTVFLSGLHVYPDMKHDLTPKLVEGLKGRRVVQVASGFTHVMFLTDDGAVLSCGLGEYGQLGHGDEETKLKPKLVAALEGRLITNIATTTSVAMFVENNGKVHACGDARGGRTGTGPVTAWEIHTPKQVIL